MWLVDVTDESVIYERDGQTYRAPYTISEDGAVVIGEETKVVRQTIYTPMESLRRAYASIIQEMGKRNAALDTARIKKIVELCQELLSSEEPDEDKTKEALTEAQSVMTWLKEQKTVKTEDGQQYPSQAYAYVPDVEKPSGWKLRLWEDPEKKVTRAQLGRAAAALSPGGFRGQKVQIPSVDLPAVKRKIRAEYRKLDVDDDDIPKWVKETESRLVLADYISLSEATVTGKGIAQIVVIRPGLNSSKDRYYPAEVLARDAAMFEGVKMYADHPTDDEDKQRPERSIKDWVATLKNVKADESGNIIGEAVIVEPWMQAKLAALRDKGMLQEMGISINAVGTASKGEIDGVKTNVIEKIVRVRSVDFVTEPGAGGVVQMYETGGTENDVDIISLDNFRERRPDLVKTIETGVKAVIMQEVKQKMELEEKIKELESSNETLTQERDELKAKLNEADKAQRIAEAKSQIDDAIGKSDLPDAARVRLQERFKEAETAEGIAEAVKAESDYIAALGDAGKVRNLGGSKPDTQKVRDELRESFKRMHPDWTDAQLETAVTGR